MHKVQLKDFEQLKAQYLKYLHWNSKKKGKKDESIDNPNHVKYKVNELELKYLQDEYNTLLEDFKDSRDAMRGCKDQFLKEQDNPLIGKVMGQTIREGFETIMKSHRNDMGCYFGGNIQGNGCRR